MANLYRDGSKFVMSTVDNYVLGTAGLLAGLDSTWAIHIVSNAATGSITVSTRSASPMATNKSANMDVAGDDIAFVPTVYKGLYVNGAAGTGALVSTAITGSSVILVPASGQQISLNVTALSAGTFTVYAVPVAGAAA